jgi:hypothetical protein
MAATTPHSTCLSHYAQKSVQSQGVVRSELEHFFFAFHNIDWGGDRLFHCSDRVRETVWLSIGGRTTVANFQRFHFFQPAAVAVFV